LSGIRFERICGLRDLRARREPNGTRAEVMTLATGPDAQGHGP